MENFETECIKCYSAAISLLSSHVSQMYRKTIRRLIEVQLNHFLMGSNSICFTQCYSLEITHGKRDAPSPPPSSSSAPPQSWSEPAGDQSGIKPDAGGYGQKHPSPLHSIAQVKVIRFSIYRFLCEVQRLNGSDWRSRRTTTKKNLWFSSRLYLFLMCSVLKMDSVRFPHRDVADSTSGRFNPCRFLPTPHM